MRNMEGQMYKEIKLICNRIRRKGTENIYSFLLVIIKGSKSELPANT